MSDWKSANIFKEFEYVVRTVLWFGRVGIEFEEFSGIRGEWSGVLGEEVEVRTEGTGNVEEEGSEEFGSLGRGLSDNGSESGSDRRSAV